LVRGAVRLLAVCLFAACGPHATKTPVVTSCGVATGDRAVDQAAERAVHCVRIELLAATTTPVVHARIDHRDVTLVVDTGGKTHIVARSFAEKTGATIDYLGVAASDPQRGGVVSNMAIELAADWRFTPPKMVTADLPMLDRLAAIGLLVPQLLADRDHVIVVDVPGRRMFVLARKDAAALTVADATHGPLTEPVPACDATGGEVVPGITFLIPATVGGVAAKLEIDTGAGRSHLYRDSPVVGPLEPTATTLIAEVRIGSLTMRGDFELREQGETPRCSADGLLGEDVLSRCVLILDQERAVVRCPLEAKGAT
jgi:hypothetical protein